MEFKNCNFNILICRGNVKNFSANIQPVEIIVKICNLKR